MTGGDAGACAAGGYVRPVAVRLGWTELDHLAVESARVLAADAVQRAGTGHPGTAMSLAPVAYLLFQEVMRHNPRDARWLGRDRFVLSCGHSSLTLYLQLYLAGYGLEMADLKKLRTWGSAAPGHPEHRQTAGVEITTGPLGHGVGSAVGMAMAARRERGLLDPEPAHGQSVFDHYVYVLASDGDLMEGLSAESATLAGNQQLGNLVLIYDQNRISSEDDADSDFTEDVGARFSAYGWHVQHLDWSATGAYVEDVDALYDAIEVAKADVDRPSIIVLRTVIGWPAPILSNADRAHGGVLGTDEVAATKTLLGFDPRLDFHISPGVLAHTRRAADRGAEMAQIWAADCTTWRATHPDQAALLDRLTRQELPAGWIDALPTFPAHPEGMATRQASGAILDALAPVMPELWGGSPDLATNMSAALGDGLSFVHQTADRETGPYGRILHFGVCEHAVGAALNGIALQSLTRPYRGTFLVFSDYIRPSVRLAALMKLPVTYVWSHDFVGLGEDGSSPQPVEQLASLRSIPGLDIVRPADANETVWAWRTILEHTDRAAGLILSRQSLPVLDRLSIDSTTGCDTDCVGAYAPADGVARGGYILADADSTGPGDGHAPVPAVILIATGPEVHLALAARDQLQNRGIAARVVSMPCREWFAVQPVEYRDQVLPPAVRARVSVEAASGQGWREIVGDAGRIVSLDHVTSPADHQRLDEELGLTADAVTHAALDSLRGVCDGMGPGVQQAASATGHTSDQTHEQLASGPVESRQACRSRS